MFERYFSFFRTFRNIRVRWIWNICHIYRWFLWNKKKCRRDFVTLLDLGDRFVCHQHYNTMNNWWSSLSHYLYQDFFVAVFLLRLPSSPILHKEFSRVLCFRFTQEKSSDNDVIMNFWWRHHIWSSYESPPAFPTWTVSWLIPPFNQLTPWCNYFVSIILTAKYHLPRLTTIWLTTS